MLSPGRAGGVSLQDCVDVIVFETMFNRESRIWYLNVFLLALSRFFLNFSNCSAGSLISVSGNPLSYTSRNLFLWSGTFSGFFSTFSADNDVANFYEDFRCTRTFDSSGTPSRFPARLETLPCPLAIDTAQSPPDQDIRAIFRSVSDSRQSTI